MRVLLFWNSQFVGHNGGMEKVFCNLSNALCRRGHQVSGMYCTERTGEIYTPLDPAFRLINLANRLSGGGWESVRPLSYVLKRECIRIFSKGKMKEYKFGFMISRLSAALRQILEEIRPDVMISFDVDSTLLLQAVSDIPVITMCHFNAEQILDGLFPLAKEAFEKSAVVQVLMKGDMRLFSDLVPKAHVVHIPNIVPTYEGIDWEKDHKEPLIIDVARMDKKQKRQHLLIEAFAQVAPAYPSWHLALCGSEQESHRYTDALKKLIQSHHLEGRVSFEGDVADVLSVYRRASIFGFPSAYEGFPLAMTEAMSAGLPVVAYESCPAVNELVKHGSNGFLVKDGVKPYAEALEKLMKDAALREKLGRQGREDMKDYEETKIYDRWERLLEEVKATHRPKA